MGHMQVYDAVVSLVRDLEMLLNHLRDGLYFHDRSKDKIEILRFNDTKIEIFRLKEKIENIYKILRLMDSLLRDSSSPGSESYSPALTERFADRILHSLHSARTWGDYIFNWVDNVFESSNLIPDLRFSTNIKTPEMDLPQMELELTQIINDLKMSRRQILDDYLAQPVEDSTSSDRTTGSKLLTNDVLPSSTNKDGKLIGHHQEFEEMLSCLTGQPSHLQIHAFTGMAGIGKSTFSKRLFDHPCAVEYFYVRSWITLSQQYQLRKVLLGLLSSISNPPDSVYEWSDDELKERIYKSLKGQRYLTVLDDMWDPQAWNDLRRVFPDDINGSRIILTSRLRDVCVYASSDIQPHCLRYLTPDESWELFCSKIFKNESCPPELAAVGKRIANKCQGLPLALVVVGGLLSGMKKMLATWEEVAKSVASLVMEDHGQCQKVLALSYNNLSDPLKACLLYMGIYPEDHDIHAKELVSLWVSEGFIPPSEEKSLEEVARSYLESLVARSLVLVKSRSSNGKIKTCGLHDLMRDFCLRGAKKENFFCVVDRDRQEPLENLSSQRRVALHSGFHGYIRDKSLSQFSGLSRSFFCYEALGPTDLKDCSDMYVKSLRILDIIKLHLARLPLMLISLLHLRYLAITIQTPFHMSKLFRLYSLQTLIVCCKWDGCLPKEFWSMLELRHLYLKGRCASSVLVDKVLPDSFPRNMLLNLQTLSTIRPINCTEEVFRSLPNLKNLGIFETEEDYRFPDWSEHLACLQQLDTLKYVFSNPFIRPSFKERHPSWGTVFPPKLMKLTLSGTSLPWEDMIHLSELPNLEVLKLKNYAFSGPVWKSTEDGFLRLKFLLIGSTNLQCWEADCAPFPRLQHLVLRHCKFLEEVPDVIGDIYTLEKIELHCCSVTAATSAKNLQEDKDWLTVYITKDPNEWLSGELKNKQEVPKYEGSTSVDVSSCGVVNEAPHLVNSQDLGERSGENETTSNSKSKGKISLLVEKLQTESNSDEENEEGNHPEAYKVCDDEEEEYDDDLYFDSDEVEYEY